MTAIREYTFDDLGDPDAPVGSKPWALWLSNEIRRVYYDKQRTGDRLRNLLDTFKEYQAWQNFGFLTYEEFCERRLQVSAQEIEDEAHTRVATLAAESKPLNGHGGKHEQVDNYQLDTEGGTSATYLTARIARDRPDILERMKAGEYRSVRAAAIEAGIVKPVTRYSLPGDPLDAARYLRERVDNEWLAEFVRALESSADFAG